MNTVLTLDTVTALQRKWQPNQCNAYATQLVEACELVLLWLESNTAANPRATDEAHAFIVQHLREEDCSAEYDRQEAADCCEL
jgi:hypothetical protein